MERRQDPAGPRRPSCISEEGRRLWDVTPARGGEPRFNSGLTAAEWQTKPPGAAGSSGLDSGFGLAIPERTGTQALPVQRAPVAPPPDRSLTINQRTPARPGNQAPGSRGLEWPRIPGEPDRKENFQEMNSLVGKSTGIALLMAAALLAALFAMGVFSATGVGAHECVSVDRRRNAHADQPQRRR